MKLYNTNLVSKVTKTLPTCTKYLITNLCNYISLFNFMNQKCMNNNLNNHQFFNKCTSCLKVQDKLFII